MEIEDRANSHPPRFVILRHELPAIQAEKSHWDLMFERRQSLFTLRCAELPTPATPNERVRVQATRLEDHRLDYLEYEGPVSGNRGSVTRWTSGCYHCLDSKESAGERFVLTASNLNAILDIPACQPGESVEIDCHRWGLGTRE